MLNLNQHNHYNNQELFNKEMLLLVLIILEKIML